MSQFRVGQSIADIQVQVNEDHDQTLFVVTNTGGYHWILTTEENQEIDHDHAQAAYPQMFLHSQTNPNTDNTQWLGLYHDGNDGSIVVGSGDLVLSASSGLVAISGTLSAHASDNGETDYVTLSHDGTQGIVETSAGELRYLPSSGVVRCRGAGNSTLIVDSTNSVARIGIVFADTSNNNHMRIQSDTSPQQCAISLASTAGRHLVITDETNVNNNHDHGATTNPTLFVHSATDPDTDNTQWVSLYHNQNQGRIETGVGELVLSGASGQVGVSGTLAVMNNAGEEAGSTSISHDGTNGVISVVTGDMVLTSAAQIYLSGGVRHGYINITDSDTPYSAVATDYIIGCDTNGGVLEIDLPAASTAGEGRVLVIKDEGGNAGSNNITIDPNGTEQIDNGGSGTPVTISANYVSISLYSDGSNWFIF